MNTSSTRYTFTFALIVCVVAGVLLSTLAEGLRHKQELNEELDVKKNILKAVALREPLHGKMTAHEIMAVYDSNIQEGVIDDAGNVVAGKLPGQILPQEDQLRPLYIYKEGDQVMAYAFPIIGHGLWSALYGYLAIEADGVTVRGITFYKHGETPGLGGEIEKEWFQDNFKGKTIYDVDAKMLTPIAVVKGKVEDIYKDSKEAKYHVDGITAATLTCKGVTALLDKWIHVYEQYLSKVRKT